MQKSRFRTESNLGEKQRPGMEWESAVHPVFLHFLARRFFGASQTQVQIMTFTSCVCACLVAQSYLTLCNPMNCSPPGSSVREIILARILERVVISSSEGSSRPGIEPSFPVASALVGGFFTPEALGKSSLTVYPWITHLASQKLSSWSRDKLLLTV